MGKGFAWAHRAVLLVDIVESVRLMEQDELGTVTDWLGLLDHVKTVVLPPGKGRLVKSLGDGMLLDFGDVRAAVSAAFAIQQASQVRNAGRPPERQILLRMGMEVSEVIVEGDDVHGHGVNLAARLMTLARPGEIVISRRVRDQLTPTLDADVEDLGDCFLRHLSQPVRAYRIGPPGRHPGIAPLASLDDFAPSIAVVPFAPRHGGCEPHGFDPDAIGEVLAEEIIAALSRSPELNVISRLSTTALRSRAFTLDEIGRHLHADYVLSGVYQGDKRRVRLDVELAEARSGRILWTEQLADDVAAILGDEQELICRIVGKVGAAVTARELQRSKLQPPPTLKAYTLLMGAIALMYRLSEHDFAEARQLLQALIERGARQPLPQAWLANWHVLRVQQGWSDDPRQDTYQALECTRRALGTDPDCSLALAIDGFVHTNLLRQLDVARESYEHALAANPSNALAWLLKGTLHAFMSEGRQAVEHTERALKLSPLDPHRYFFDSLAATACLAARQYHRALELAQRSLRANRMHTSTYRVMAVAQWQLGLRKEAQQTSRALLRLEPSFTVGGWLERSPAAPYPLGREAAEVLRQAGVPG